MQLDAGMILTRQTSAAKNPDLHFEISAVFLRQNICGGFARPEETVHSPVNPAVLADTIVVFRTRIIPACRQLLERNFIGCVTINFIGGHEYEHRIRVRLPRRFEQIQRADGIYVKVNEGDFFCLVMRRLRRAMNDDVETILLKEIKDFLAVTNVEFAMSEVFCDFSKTFKIPACVASGAEKFPPHIVVHAEHAMTFAIVINNSFGTN